MTPCENLKFQNVAEHLERERGREGEREIMHPGLFSATATIIDINGTTYESL